MNQGTCLTRARDSGKRKFEHMSATEQQVLHDFETHKFRRQHEEAGAKRMPWFKGKKLKPNATTMGFKYRYGALFAVQKMYAR